MRYSVLIIAMACFFAAQAQNYQDSVMLLNGKTFRGNVVKQTNEYLTINSLKKKGKPETQLNIETYRVYSYVQNGLEKVVYKYDSLSDNFLTADQSRSFSLGSYDAHNYYESKAVFISSTAISLGFCLFDTYLTEAEKNSATEPEGLEVGFFGRSPGIWPIASVLVLPITFGLPSTKVRTKNLQNGVRGDKYYYSGFNNTARQKRSFSALKGAATGLVLGYASYFIANSN
ncbi:MAG: hypothetical protein AB8B74_04100 [Crocinitomicaceae bacterium]